MKRQDLPPRNRWTARPYIQPAVRRPRPKHSPGLSAAELLCTVVYYCSQDTTRRRRTSKPGRKLSPGYDHQQTPLTTHYTTPYPPLAN